MAWEQMHFMTDKATAAKAQGKTGPDEPFPIHGIDHMSHMSPPPTSILVFYHSSPAAASPRAVR